MFYSQIMCVLLIQSLFCQVNTLSDMCVFAITHSSVFLPLDFIRKRPWDPLCNLTIQNHSHHSEPTPEIAVEALERVFHLRFLKSDQKKKKKKLQLRRGFRACGCQTCWISLNSWSTQFARLVMRGAFWMSSARLLGLVCATTWFAYISETEMKNLQL